MKGTLAIVSYLNFETIQIWQDCNNFNLFRYKPRTGELHERAFGQTPRKARMSTSRAE